MIIHLVKKIKYRAVCIGGYNLWYIHLNRSKHTHTYKYTHINTYTPSEIHPTLYVSQMLHSYTWIKHTYFLYA